jgi:hypothetical protein
MHIDMEEAAMAGNDELLNAVVAAAEDKGEKKFLSCASALELAGRFGVDATEIGRICNEQEIKLHQCQLGCF